MAGRLANESWQAAEQDELEAMADDGNEEDEEEQEEDPTIAPPTGALELRLRVDRAYGISRAQGVAWFDAVRYGDSKTIRSMLLAARTRDRATTTAPAPARSSSSWVERLVNYNGQATSYGFIGSTALHWAAANGDAAILELLLDNGASINAQNYGGSTALHSAAANGQFEIVPLLLRRGANPLVVDCCGDVPADVLADASVDDPKAKSSKRQIHALLEAGSMVSQMASDVQQSQASEVGGAERWSIQQMRTLLVATGACPTAEAAPKELGELRAAAVDAARGVAAVQSEAERADQRVARLQRAIQRRIDAQRQKWIADHPEDSSDDGGDVEETTAPPRQRQQRQPRSSALSPAEEAAAEDAKKKGNAAYSDGDFKAAIKWYTTALSITGGVAAASGGADATYYSNRSAAYMGLRQPHRALEDGRRAVAVRPTWAKAHHRVGTACMALGRYAEAAAAFRVGLSYAPGDATLVRGLAEAELEAGESFPTPAPSAAAAAAVAASPGGEVPSAAPASLPPLAELHQYAPGERKPWFDCVLCDNKTRDHAATPCCRRLVCGTCAKRRFQQGREGGSAAGSCPFRCAGAK